jgi:broad specificity phosphatase PhoE
MAKYGIKSAHVFSEPLLREKSAGEFEGCAYGSQAKMAKKLGVEVRKYRPEGGESHDDVLERATKFITQTFEKLYKQAPPPQPQPVTKVLVVTHGGFISEFYNACNRLAGK